MPLCSNRNAIKQMRASPLHHGVCSLLQVNKWRKGAAPGFLSFGGYCGKSVHSLLTSFDPASSTDNWRVSKPRECVAYQVREVLGEAGQHLSSKYNYSPQHACVHSMNPIGIDLRWKLPIPWRPGTGNILGLVIILSVFACQPTFLPGDTNEIYVFMLPGDSVGKRVLRFTQAR